MGLVIVYRIKNRQEDYAKCIAFYNQLCCGKGLGVDKIPKETIGYYDCEEYGYQYAYDIEKYGAKIWNDDALKSVQQGEQRICLHFQVLSDADQDIVNFIYYFVLRQIIDIEMTMVIYTNDISEEIKIGQYLRFEQLEMSVYIRTKKQIDVYNVIHRVPGTSNLKMFKFKLSKFLPLLEITEKTYYFLAMPISHFIPEDQKYCYLSAYLNLPEEKWEKNIFDTCKRLFTQYVCSKSTELFFSKEFYTIVRNIPVLTFLFLCAFRNHCEERRNVFDIEQLRLQISDARDFSEGILQIIENIVFHSQYQKGYFSFRIHDRYVQNGGTCENEYLQKEYEHYITRMDEKNYATYLELFVVDSCFVEQTVSNRSILCQRFLDNLAERGKRDERSKKFIPHFHDMEVADFFDQKKWQGYYECHENIIEHYGLQLFDKIIASCDGYFELISTNQYKYTRKNCYCSENKGMESGNVIAGTQYRILLPISQRNFIQDYTRVDFTVWPENNRRKYIGMNVHIAEVELSKKISQYNNEIKRCNYTEKQIKNLLVEYVEKTLYEYYTVELNDRSIENVILQILLTDIVGVVLIEIIFKGFLKFLIRIREEYGEVCHIHIALGNLLPESVSEFGRLMGIYYYKVGRSNLMRHTQIYFWTNKFFEDLIIAGDTLEGVRNNIFQRASLKGIYPSWLSFLNYIWKKCMLNQKGAAYVDEILPYEVLVKYEGKTLFQHIVQRTLETEIENSNVGCCMDNTHVQLGSKVHVMKFFDGQSLFLNNYFSSNYAYIVAEQLYNDIRCINKNGENKKILLVGYESYSEMLLVEVSSMLRDLIKDLSMDSFLSILPYIIAENIENDMTFRAETGQMQKHCMEILNDYKFTDLLIVFIIPINSTLTTFFKVKYRLERLLNITINKENILKNFAIIILRDDPKKIGQEDVVKDRTEIERRFWECVDKENNQIIISADESAITYLSMIFGDWRDPMKCPKCFPENFIDEKPLVKTNRSGLSPMIQIGNKHKGEGNLQKENMKRLNALADALIYKHIYRKNNHYLYYFDTNQYYSANKTDIEMWLRNVMEASLNNVEESKKYNFIVSSLHESNAGFVECVNKNIFKNNAHVIRAEFSKMYRSNFHIQYSYLRVLYKNLLKAATLVNDYSEINFFFVDDEIVSGKTFHRAKSLLESLLQDEGNKQVKINIFKAIFVLIDRLSDASKDSYIKEPAHFYSYVKFNISAIQNHDDFCYMCTLVNNAKKFKYMSATNKMDITWKKIEDKFELKRYTDVDRAEGEDIIKYKNRMLAAHYAEAVFQDMETMGNLEVYCDCIIHDLLFKRLQKRNGVILTTKNNRQIFISYIKILSRPFLVYKKEVKDATLRLLLIFMEVYLGEDSEQFLQKNNIGTSYEEELLAICNMLGEWRDNRDDYTRKMLIDFMEQLTDIDSTYIIRKENIKRIFRLFNQIKGKRERVKLEENSKEKCIDEKDDFELQYTVFIKQLASGGNDETKSMWIENLFLTGCEDEGANVDEDFINQFGYKSEFGQKVILENTKIIYDAIKYLVGQLGEGLVKEYVDYLARKDDANAERDEMYAKFDAEVEKKIGGDIEFYLQNFKMLLEKFDYKVDDPKTIRLLSVQCMMHILMFQKEAFQTDFDRFYKELYLLYLESGDAEIVQILMIQEEKSDIMSNNAPYVIYDQRVEDNQRRHVKLVDKPILTKEKLLNAKYQMDTYHIDKEHSNVILKFDIGIGDDLYKDNIYVALHFDNMSNMKRVLFMVRLLLIYRSRTLNRMKQDFGNNLFQNLCQAKQYATFLEHFKNVTHSDPEKEQAVSVLTTILKQDIGSLRSERENYYIAACFKLLSDINVSTLYHNIIADKVMNNAIDSEVLNENVILRDINILKRINGVIFEQYRNIKNCKLPNINLDENLRGKRYYYLGIGVHCTPLLVVSLLQNAYKYGDLTTDIRIWYEPTDKFGHKLEYLCMSNGVLEESLVSEEIFHECILKPIGRRKFQNMKTVKDGITLFSANIYCKKLYAEIVANEEKTCPDQMIDVCLGEREIIIKLPVMEGKI